MTRYQRYVSPPPTDGIRLAALRVKVKRNNEIYVRHVAELTEALFAKYLESPDRATRRLLISHMGSAFFDRMKAAGRDGDERLEC
jgi:hypothetical protein